MNQRKVSKATGVNFVRSLKIASPCQADWNQMEGDEQRRFCAACQKNVYNVSHLTGDEIKSLIQRYEADGLGTPCMRLRRRHDGTVVTNNCPVGLKQVRRKIALLTSVIIGFLSCSVLGSTFLNSSTSAGEVTSSSHSMPLHHLGRIAPDHFEMGDVGIAHPDLSETGL